MGFSVTYLPTTLFSLKDSNSTSSGAKSLFLPSPYAIKMAILNQAITVGGDLEKLKDKKRNEFDYIKDAEISFHIPPDSNFCVNNTFVRILKRRKKKFKSIPSFREYIFLSHSLEVIFETDSVDAKEYLKQYLHKINYFGKRGCFFQFLAYSEEPKPQNVKLFEANSVGSGVLQEYDDFDEELIFKQVNNLSSGKKSHTKRKKEILVLPLKKMSSSKSFTLYKMIK
jgi:hypothetical protein